VIFRDYVCISLLYRAHGQLATGQYYCCFTALQAICLPIMAHTTVQQMRLAVDLLDQGNEQGCITTLQALLLQPTLPPFWRIHALALLAHTVDDWFEAKVRLSFRVQGVEQC
jgi:hypothetical protein